MANVVNRASLLCHRHTNRRLRRSMDDGAKHMEHKKLGTTQKHEDRDEERDKTEWNKSTGLMC